MFWYSPIQAGIPGNQAGIPGNQAGIPGNQARIGEETILSSLGNKKFEQKCRKPFQAVI